MIVRRIRLETGRIALTITESHRGSDRWQVLEGDQPRTCRGEPAGVEVEGTQAVVEVHVQPLAPGSPGVLSRGGDEREADAPATGVRRNQRVEDERVNVAVPGHVHESDQASFVAGAHPTKAVPVDLRPPLVDRELVGKALRVQGADLGVLERPSPLIVDHRVTLGRR
jgi:hypothetical protein